MRRSTDCIIFAMTLCLVAAAQQQQPFPDLRCENATSPRGVRVPQPKLTWVLAPNAVQVAYQVLVASSEEKLKADEADLWDSGRVISDKTMAQYRGKPLTSFQKCYWKVRTWGSYYSVGRYTEPGTWQMGLMSFEDRKSN